MRGARAASSEVAEAKLASRDRRPKPVESAPVWKGELGIDLEWKPRVDTGLKELEISGHHADDPRRVAVHVHGATEDRGIRGELIDPERVTQDGDVPGSTVRFVRREITPEYRSNT